MSQYDFHDRSLDENLFYSSSPLILLYSKLRPEQRDGVDPGSEAATESQIGRQLLCVYCDRLRQIIRGYWLCDGYRLIAVAIGSDLVRQVAPARGKDR